MRSRGGQKVDKSGPVTLRWESFDEKELEMEWELGQSNEVLSNSSGKGEESLLPFPLAKFHSSVLMRSTSVTALSFSLPSRVYQLGVQSSSSRPSSFLSPKRTKLG